MYGVLYTVSPEIFPAKDRGTGNGLVSTATRIFGIVVSSASTVLSNSSASDSARLQAPVIALYANLETALPVYIAGA